MQLLIVSMTIFQPRYRYLASIWRILRSKLTAMNDRNNMEEENVSISEREEDEDKNV